MYNYIMNSSMWKKYGIVLLISGSVYAQTLTWSDCVALASANNTTLLISREQLFQQKESLNAARASFWPQISVGANTQHAEQTVQEPVKSSSESDSVGYNLSVKQDVFTGFRNLATAQAAEKNLRAAEYEYLVTESNIRLNTRKAFIALLKAQEQKELMAAIAARREQNYALIKLRYEGGREHKGALLLAEANLAQAKADVAQSLRAITLAQYTLNAAMSTTLSALVVTESAQLAAHTAVREYDQYVSESPLLKQLVEKIDAAKYSATAIKASQLPQVYASYQTGRSGDSWPPENSSWSLGANISFTLFDGNNNGANAAKADSAVTQARLQYLSGEQTVLTTLAQAHTDLENARDTLSVSEHFLKAAEERATIADAQYAAGLMTFDDWSTIEDSRVNAQKNHVLQRAALLQAEASWIQAIGGGLDAN